MDSINTLDFTSIIHTISSLKETLTTLQKEIKTLEKHSNKNIKILSREIKKKKGGNKKPSGFAKPTKISDELREFLGLSNNYEYARTDITKFINKYIKQHNLQNPNNRREIIPNEKLIELLNIKKGETLNYFNLQKYMNKHYVK
tara:strand:- start:6734 stop:7165 length:432 start_codon:yes stop_codon:yes gene_type:complete